MSAPTVDLEDAMARFDGDKDFYFEMLNEFLSGDEQKYTSELQTAIQAQDVKARDDQAFYIR